MFGKKDNNDDDEDDDIFNDEFFEQLNEQFKSIMDGMPFKLPANFDFTNDFFKNMFKNIMKNMNLDPRTIKDMDPDEIQDILKKSKFSFKGPFMFGFNMGFDKNGKPKWNNFGNVKPQPEGEGEPEIQHERDPLVDIYEEGEDLVVVCEVPGVNKKNIELRASPTELEVVAGSKDNEVHSRKYHKIIPLPIKIDENAAKARYNNGILEVRLKKVGEVKRKKKVDIQ